jgi:small subunit ribosomal protein S9
MAEENKTEQGEGAEPQEQAAEEQPQAAADEQPQAPAEEPQTEADEPQAPAEAPQAEADEPQAPAEAPQAEADEQPQAAADEQPAAEADATDEVDVKGDEVVTHEDVEDEQEDAPTPRVKPAIPGADLEVDIVREGEEALRGGSPYDEDAEEDGAATGDGEAEDFSQPIAHAAIDLAADARYRATGKRKTAVARVTLRPGTGEYLINGRSLDVFFPRDALQRTIRQPLETVGYETRMDVVATMHGGGVSAQAGALRHGVSRALLEADPNLRSELKRRGFLTRDPRVKERKKAGLKKARKRPQFSKR